MAREPSFCGDPRCAPAPDVPSEFPTDVDALELRDALTVELVVAPNVGPPNVSGSGNVGSSAKSASVKADSSSSTIS
jgi:hypothetical protein